MIVQFITPVLHGRSYKYGFLTAVEYFDVVKVLLKHRLFYQVITMHIASRIISKQLSEASVDEYVLVTEDIA